MHAENNKQLSLATGDDDEPGGTPTRSGPLIAVSELGPFQEQTVSASVMISTGISCRRRLLPGSCVLATGMQTSATTPIQADREASDRRIQAQLQELVRASNINVHVPNALAGTQTSALTPIQVDDARDLRAQLVQQKVSASSIPISMCLRPEGPTTVLRCLEC